MAITAGINNLAAGTTEEVSAGSDIRILDILGVIQYRPKGDGTTSPTGWNTYSGTNNESLQCSVDTYIRSAEDIQIEVITGVA